MFPVLMETKQRAASDGDDDSKPAMKQGAAAASKRRPRTDNSDYLLPMSATGYLDIINDTGQFWNDELTTC